LPDKAIDLVDESAAKLKMEMDSRPLELDEIDRRIRQLEMERFSLQKEKDATAVERVEADGKVIYKNKSSKAVQDRLERLDNEMNELSDRFTSLNDRWQLEKDAVTNLRSLKEQIDQTKQQIDQMEREFNLNKAAELKYGKLTELEKNLDEAELEISLAGSEGSLSREQVTEDDIAEIVARWTGIPLNKLLLSERQKLLTLEKHLHDRVIGQEEAVTSVASAIRRARAGMNDPNRPIGSFLFLGPTGVGKTELARTLAEFLFDSDASMVRIDMSEYMEKHSVSRLIGAPPGYVGYEEGGQFSEAVRRHPYSVVLFDEVEKAHPDVFNILLQVLDDGRITDSQGRLVDCKNTVIIMTSNIGSDRILEVSKDLSSDLDGDSRYDEMRDKVLDVLRNHFRPEFLNRIDETVIFHALRRNEIRSIAALQIKRIENRLSDRKISLKLSEEAKDYIAAVGYDPSYGARPLKRAIQREIENPIANKILEGTFAEGHQISITVEDDKLVFS
jgi:ATP-dependent Clp protease ATP-binding subunit ClpB